MTVGFPWSTALKIAWRQSRSATGKFLFVMFAVAVGVGSLTGVRSFSDAFRTMLLREARTLMAADMTVRNFDLTTPEQETILGSLEKKDIRITRITETVSMMSSSQAGDPVLVSVKAVDPSVYPFYGTVRLDPPGPLASRLRPDSVAVSDDLLLRLKAAIGDRVRLGGEELEIVGVVAMEPDRLTGSLNVGPRALISREALDRTGLIRPGSRAAQRYLLRLPTGGPGVEAVRSELLKAFPTAMVADYRQTHPLITRGLNRATRFLSLVSLIALIVGALGVAMAIHSHIQQKIDTIAVMKSIGARSAQLIRIYLLQTLMVAGVGGLAGVLVGIAIQAAFPFLIARYLPLRPALTIDWAAAVQGIAIGLLTTLLFTLAPLLSLRRIRPALILRREMEETQASRTIRWRDFRAVAMLAGTVIAGIAAIAIWLAGGPLEDAVRIGSYFAGGLAVSLAVLSGIAWLLLRGLRLMLRRSSRTLPAALRHGLANLYRPGNQAQAVLVALGIGVTFIVAIYLIQDSMLEEILASAPPGMPNVFLINITERERDPLIDLLSRQPGVTERPEIVGSVAARLVAVNGAAAETLYRDGPARRFLQPRSVTWAASKPEQTEVVRGTWWNAQAKPADHQLAITEDTARMLKVEPGAVIAMQASGRRIEATIAVIFRVESLRPGRGIEFIFSPGALDGLPLLYFGGIRVEPRRVAGIQRVVYEKFPAVTVVNVADVIEIVQQVVDQIALVVRFVSFFAILAGVVILASSVAGTRFRRVREVVILKTLGATRGRVAGIFSIEFLLLGSVAGLMGSLLASGFSQIVLTRLLEADFRFDLLPIAAAVTATALVANLAGWLASFRLLQQKPLEVLRAE